MFPYVSEKVCLGLFTVLCVPNFVCVCVYECSGLNIFGYLNVYILVLLSVKPISLGDSLFMWPMKTMNLSISPYISFNSYISKLGC